MDKWKQPGVQAATQETSAGLSWIASSIWEVCVCVGGLGRGIFSIIITVLMSLYTNPVISHFWILFLIIECSPCYDGMILFLCMSSNISLDARHYVISLPLEITVLWCLLSNV